MDHHCFIRHAVELARPDGGRICLLVPEGLLSRDNRRMPALREALLEDCQPRAVISLPRVFKNNRARMAIVYLTRDARTRAASKVLLSEVVERWTDSNGEEQTTDIFGELERIVSAHLSAEDTR